MSEWTKKQPTENGFYYYSSDNTSLIMLRLHNSIFYIASLSPIETAFIPGAGLYSKINLPEQGIGENHEQ